MLNDYKRRQALKPFLNAANTIRGACITFIVSKKVKHLCTPPGSVVQIQNQVGLHGHWNQKGFERAMRLIQFPTLLIAGFAQAKQNVYWISDEDDIFANRLRSEDVTCLASSFLSLYAKFPLGELGLGTTGIGEADRKLEDLVSVPDLVAGATAELATAISALHGGSIPYGLALVLPLPPKLSWKAKLISDWLGDDTQTLKRIIITFDLVETGALRVSRFALE